MLIRILLYEDNDHLRESLSFLIRFHPDFDVVLAKPNPANVLEEVRNERPDAILMDIDMPVVDGVEAVRRLRAANLDVPVIMLTVFDDNDHIYDAICAGANGYLLKNDFDQVISAIRDVLSGGAPLTGSVAKKVLAAFARRAPAKPKAAEILTERENEILECLVKGNSYKMIADQLSLSMDTIRTHIKKIYKKLQVNSATEAVYKAKLDGFHPS